MSHTQSIGQAGENQAVIHLQKIGYKILSRNFRTKFGEIDIIARDDNTLVFVEVKNRSSLNYGYPEDAITNAKLHRLNLAIQFYCHVNNIQNTPQRIDVIAIDSNGIRHLQNITL